MLDFIKKVFIGSLSLWTIRGFGVSLLSIYKEPIKCVSLTIIHVTLGPRLLI